MARRGVVDLLARQAVDDLRIAVQEVEPQVEQLDLLDDAGHAVVRLELQHERAGAVALRTHQLVVGDALLAQAMHLVANGQQRCVDVERVDAGPYAPRPGAQPGLEFAVHAVGQPLFLAHGLAEAAHHP